MSNLELWNENVLQIYIIIYELCNKKCVYVDTLYRIL